MIYLFTLKFGVADTWYDIENKNGSYLEGETGVLCSEYELSPRDAKALLLDLFRDKNCVILISINYQQS